MFVELFTGKLSSRSRVTFPTKAVNTHSFSVCECTHPTQKMQWVDLSSLLVLLYRGKMEHANWRKRLISSEAINIILDSGLLLNLLDELCAMTKVQNTKSAVDPFYCDFSKSIHPHNQALYIKPMFMLHTFTQDIL